jgi:GDSL-like Lipase/Acylhydrolase family
MQKRNAWAAVLAVGLSTVATILLLEVVLHAVGFPRTKTGHQRFFVEYDADRGWRNVPGARGQFSTDEYDVALEYNSRGIRGPERAYEKPPGTYRIVMLGDSFIEGYSVPREERVAEVLEGLLAARDPSRRYEVIALGTAGYSTDQELLWLESEGLRYRPDLVVVMFYMNDVWFNGQSKYWRGEKPAFVLEDGALRLTNVPVPDTRSEKAKTAKNRDRGHGLKHWIRANSKLYALAARSLENSPGLREWAARLGLISPRDEPREDDGGPQVADELSVFQKDEPKATESAWEVTEALLARMARSAAAAGAGFVAFHIPFKGVVYPESWGPILTRLGIPEAGLDRERVRDRFLGICRQQGLDCIEPTDRFTTAAAERARDGQRLYYVQDNHWNPGGHRLAAEILAEEVERQRTGSRDRPSPGRGSVSPGAMPPNGGPR